MKDEVEVKLSIPSSLLEEVRELAEQEFRSVEQELLYLVARGVLGRKSPFDFH